LDVISKPRGIPRRCSVAVLGNKDLFLGRQNGHRAERAFLEVSRKTVTPVMLGASPGQAAKSKALVNISPCPVLEQSVRRHHATTNHETRAWHVFAKGHQSAALKAKLIFLPYRGVFLASIGTDYAEAAQSDGE